MMRERSFFPSSSRAPRPRRAAAFESLEARTLLAFTFGPASNTSAGSIPVGIAVADFTGDNKQDIVVANAGSDNVSLLPGNGTGGFGARTNFEVGNGPSAVITGFFNADNRPDIAVANLASHDVSILLNAGGTGLGTFSAAEDFPLGFEGNEFGPTSLDFGDFNGDGAVDLVTANVFSHNISVLLNGGDGSFSFLDPISVGPGPSAVAVGLFDAGTVPDVAVVSQDSGSVNVLLGAGDGTFTDTGEPYPVGVAPTSVAVGDFDGDLNADLAVANYDSNSVTILLGAGDGLFADAGNTAAGNGAASVRVSDFNLDGRQDLVVAATEANNVRLLQGGGDGSFSLGINLATGNQSDPGFAAAGDLNGDGKPDVISVASALSSANVRSWLNTTPIPANVSATASDPEAAESAASPDSAALRLSRSGPTTAALQVFFQLSGQATPEADYDTGAATFDEGTGRYSISIPAGAAFVDVVLTPVNDQQREGTEAATLTLVPPVTGATYNVVAPSSATAYLADDDVLSGDINLDGSVDVADLGIFATNYGRTSGVFWGDGDFNHDSRVDVSDLGALATNYGQSTPVALTASVRRAPSPAPVTVLDAARRRKLRRRAAL